MEEPEISSYGRSTQKDNNIKNQASASHLKGQKKDKKKNPAGTLYNPSGLAA